MNDRERPDSNYEIFKQNALKRFLTFDRKLIIERLRLETDEDYIYVNYFGIRFRFRIKEPCLEYRETTETGETPIWREAGPNETLTLCDLLCHTPKEITLSDRFVTLQSLNRVKGGNTSSTLGGGMFRSTEQLFDGKTDQLRDACLKLGGVQAGKGDVAFEIPIFEPIHVRFSFYGSDEEFDAKITVLFPEDICEYLHYETLYYVVMTLIEQIKKKMQL